MEAYENYSNHFTDLVQKILGENVFENQVLWGEGVNIQRSTGSNLVP